jgi:hypothetical protein
MVLDPVAAFSGRQHHGHPYVPWEDGTLTEQLASKAEIARDSLSKPESGKREMGLDILGRS